MDQRLLLSALCVSGCDCMLLTCCFHEGSRRLHNVPVDGLGPRLFLETPRSWLDDLVHIHHQLELLLPQILVPDVLPSGLLVILLLLLCLSFQPEGQKKKNQGFVLD